MVDPHRRLRSLREQTTKNERKQKWQGNGTTRSFNPGRGVLCVSSVVVNCKSSGFSFSLLSFTHVFVSFEVQQLVTLVSIRCVMTFLLLRLRRRGEGRGNVPYHVTPPASRWSVRDVSCPLNRHRHCAPYPCAMRELYQYDDRPSHAQYDHGDTNCHNRHDGSHRDNTSRNCLFEYFRSALHHDRHHYDEFWEQHNTCSRNDDRAIDNCRIDANHGAHAEFFG